MSKLEQIKQRKIVIISMVAFWVNFAIILVTHLLTNTTDLHIDYSISKYVGLTVTSSIAFLIVNVAVSIALWKYLKPLIKSNIQRYLLLYIVVMLIGLSLCPIHLYDNVIPEPIIMGRAPISFLHVITSRTMFVAMMLFSIVTFCLGEFRKKYNRITTSASLVFMIYAIICVAAFVFFPQIFWSFDIIFESLYIAFFFLVVTFF